MDEQIGKRDKEEEYFRKQDRELVERMRKAAADEAVRGTLGAQTGIKDPQLLQDIAALGFSTETVSLLPLVPILQVAWADEAISPEERKLIVDFARLRGVAEGSPADRLLAEWLVQRPPADVFSRAIRLVAAMLAAGSDTAHTLSVDDLVKYSESIASASGGILGLGKVSAGERAALEQIQTALRKR
jgi:hypothetical protein